MKSIKSLQLITFFYGKKNYILIFTTRKRIIKTYA